MFSALFPKEDWDSAYEKKEYKRLYENGIRGIIFDIDNTMVEHGAPVNEKAIFLVNFLKETGFNICFLSNNKEPRVKSFCEPLGALYIYKGGKPKREGYEKAVRLLDVTKEQTVSVGDQIFTDIWGANRAGIYTVLVKPIGTKEEIQIVLKRYLERIVLFFYQRRKRGGAKA